MQWFAAILMAFGLGAPVSAQEAGVVTDRGCVILLHGLARSDLSMELAEQVLQRAGYTTVNIDYPSTGDTIPALAEMAIPPSRAACAAHSDQPPFVLTHSMGGILMRWWAQAHPDDAWSRVVMLAPPNQGSELVDALEDLAPFRLINGPAGMQLGTKPGSVPRALGPVGFDLGVIAGDRSLNAFYSMLLPGPDDGKVTVAATQVAGMADHLVLPMTHTFLMNSPEVLAQTLEFFEHGAFNRTIDFGDAVEIIATE